MDKRVTAERIISCLLEQYVDHTLHFSRCSVQHTDVLYLPEMRCIVLEEKDDPIMI